MATQTANKWDEPQKIDDVMVAFPTTVTGVLLPARADVPEEFRRDRSPWCRVVGRWFFRGLNGFAVREGIDRTTALRHLKACMGSWEPKHEDKTAGVAYLMSLWCDPAMLTNEEPATDAD